MEPEAKHRKLDPQQIDIHDSFIETEAALRPDLCHLTTQLHLEQVQIESALLISCIRRMQAIENIDLIDITLFGGIFLEEHEKLALPRLARLRVHLNQLHDGSDNDDAPEILPGKVRSLLFVQPPPPPNSHHCLDIELKVLHENGFWQDYFTISEQGPVVYSALDWNEHLTQFVDLPRLRALSLHDCAVNNELVPLHSLASLTLSAIQSDSAHFTQLLAMATASTTLESLTLRQQSSLNLDNLLNKATGFSNLKELTIISTEIEDVSHSKPLSSSAQHTPFPRLTSLALVDCNLSQDFTNVHKKYFKDVANVRIQEFPISCELVHFIMQESPSTRSLELRKFNLDSSWEAESEPTNQYYQFVQHFLSSKGIAAQEGSRSRLSLALEKGSDGNWKCSSVKATEGESELGDEFETLHRESTAVRFSEVGILTAEEAEILNLELQDRNVEQLRIIELRSLTLDWANLQFLFHCTNIVVLKLENMKVSDLNLKTISPEISPSPVFPRLQKYVLDLATAKSKDMIEEMSQQLAISDFIWFTTPKLNELSHSLSWDKLEITIEINRRTVFEMNWRTGLLNFGFDRHGSEILADPQFVTSFTIKQLHLRDLSHAIPAPLQSKLEALYIESCDLYYGTLAASIAHCEQLKQLDLRDVIFVGIPEGTEYGVLKSLEKVTFRKRGT